MNHKNIFGKGIVGVEVTFTMNDMFALSQLNEELKALDSKHTPVKKSIAFLNNLVGNQEFKTSLFITPEEVEEQVKPEVTEIGEAIFEEEKPSKKISTKIKTNITSFTGNEYNSEQLTELYAELHVSPFQLKGDTMFNYLNNRYLIKFEKIKNNKQIYTIILWNELVKISE